MSIPLDEITQARQALHCIALEVPQDVYSHAAPMIHKGLDHAAALSEVVGRVKQILNPCLKNVKLYDNDETLDGMEVFTISMTLYEARKLLKLLGE